MNEAEASTWTLAPYLVVDGAAAAIEFYRRAFGAEEVARMPTPDGSRLVHAALMIGGSTLFLSDDFGDRFGGGGPRHPKALGGSPVTLHLQVPDVDAVVERAVEAGAEITMPVADMFWGNRYGRLRDPFGHEWSIATAVRRPSTEEMRTAVGRLFGGDGGGA